MSALGADAALDDVSGLLAAWNASAEDSDPDTRLAIVRMLATLAQRDTTLFGRLDAGFVRPPGDALLRGAAEDLWPQLAARWGPSWPIETGRTLEDYRGIVRTLMLARDNPSIVIEVDGRGTSRSSCSRVTHRSRSPIFCGGRPALL